MFFFKKKKPNVHVYVRHATFSENSKHKKRHSYFSKEGCFQNLIHTIDPNFKMTILLDTFHGQDHFVKKQTHYPVIEIKEGTDAGSFNRLLEVATKDKHKPDDILYFLEEDYLHQEGWSNVLLEAFDLPVDYVTLYDHKDKYFFPQYEELTSKIYHTQTCHFRTVPSTTNTYAMKAKTLKKDLNIHFKFCNQDKITRDHEKFCTLTSSGAILVSSMPGYSTHMEPEFASPCVDWEKIFKKFQQDSKYDCNDTCKRTC